MAVYGCWAVCFAWCGLWLGTWCCMFGGLYDLFVGLRGGIGVFFLVVETSVLSGWWLAGIACRWFVTCLICLFEVGFSVCLVLVYGC